MDISSTAANNLLISPPKDAILGTGKSLVGDLRERADGRSSKTPVKRLLATRPFQIQIREIRHPVVIYTQQRNITVFIKMGVST